MSYILGIAVVIIFFAALHYFTELNHTQKTGITVGFIFLIGGMYAYNVMGKNAREHTNAIILQYNQGKTVKCEGMDVNKTNFSLSVGTQTFIGREGTEHYARMFSAAECQ